MGFVKQHRAIIESALKERVLKFPLRKAIVEVAWKDALLDQCPERNLDSFTEAIQGHTKRRWTPDQVRATASLVRSLALKDFKLHIEDKELTFKLLDRTYKLEITITDNPQHN